MKKFIQDQYEKKLLFLVGEYEMVKNKSHPLFKTIKQLADYLQVSRKHLWELNKRKKKKLTIMPAKRGPKKPWNKPSKENERIVIFIKRNTEMNNYEISVFLKTKGISISEKGIGNILRRYPLNKKKEKILRYEKQNPGELGHMDVHKLQNVKGQNPKEKKYLAALEDDCTRITYHEMITDKKALTLKEFTQRAMAWFAERYLICFQAIMTDNGKEFTTHWKAGKKKHIFEKFLKEEDIRHCYTKPYRPQTNGKIEAFWKIINKDLFSRYKFRDWAEVKTALGKYIEYYNGKRKHGGINRLTPEEKLIKLINIDQYSVTELIA